MNVLSKEKGIQVGIADNRSCAASDTLGRAVAGFFVSWCVTVNLDQHRVVHVIPERAFDCL